MQERHAGALHCGIESPQGGFTRVLSDREASWDMPEQQFRHPRAHVLKGVLGPHSMPLVPDSILTRSSSPH